MGWFDPIEEFFTGDSDKERKFRADRRKEEDDKKAEEAGKTEFERLKGIQKVSDDTYVKAEEDAGNKVKQAGGIRDIHDDANDKHLQEGQEKLLGEATEQSKSSEERYGDLTTRMTGLMDDADIQAKSAMSLEEYMNPDNKVAQATRALYERQAQGEQNRGIADYGVMSSLGAQSAANAMGGMGPLSLGQQMAYIGQGQGQAGEAFAAAQRRVQGLRDQGLAQGFEQSDKAYNAGVGAKERQSRLVGQAEGLQNSRNTAGANFRGEISGYQGNIHGIQGQINARPFNRVVSNANIDTGVAKTKHGFESAANAGSLDERNALRTIQANERIAQRNAEAAERAGDKSMFGGVLNAGATVASAVYGGPAGATVANAATSGIPLAGDGSYTPPTQQPIYQSPYGGRYGVKPVGVA